MDDVARLIKAADFAAFKHRRQRRKDAEASPYINTRWRSRACSSSGGRGRRRRARGRDPARHGGDTETTVEELEREFGHVIAAIVAEVTDDENLPKPERKRLQVERAPHISQHAKW